MTFRGERVEFPVIAVIGFIGMIAILVVHDDHPSDRPHRGPVVDRLRYHSLLHLSLHASDCRSSVRKKRDWRSEQVEILRRAGELELMDEYVANVRASENGATKRRRRGLVFAVRTVLSVAMIGDRRDHHRPDGALSD